MVRVRLGDSYRNEQSVLLEADDELQDETGLQVDSSLITPDSGGYALLLITKVIHRSSILILK